jgi:hypothetical protein
VTKTELVRCVCGEEHEAVWMSGIRIVPCPYAPKDRIYLFSEPSRLSTMASIRFDHEETDK